MPGGADHLDALEATTKLMDRWTKECFQGSASPNEILQSLCEVGVYYNHADILCVDSFVICFELLYTT